MSGSSIAQLIAEKRVIVCCGAGGVGKTSVAAALAVGGARLGRKVLVVTIDPSRRLAESLGVEPHAPEPVELAADRLKDISVNGRGALGAWMLDPQVISENVVRRFASDPAQRERLLGNRIFRNVTAMIAGMQEYTAVQAMYEFVQSGRYDLVLIDTPPSRNALHFLEAPRRIARFIDGRVFRFFLPGDKGIVKRNASKAINRVMDIALGESTREELMTFFSLFAELLKRLNSNAEEMRQFFRSSEVSFLVVTSPAREALEETRYFERRARDELKLSLGGFVLNRSLASSDAGVFPDKEFFADSGVSVAAQDEVARWANREQRLIESHRALLAELDARAGAESVAKAVPFFRGGVSDLRTLALLADHLGSETG